MVKKIGLKTFSGTSDVFNGTLAAVLIAVLTTSAIRQTSTVADVTDSSGGTASSAVPAIAALTPSILVGTTMAQKASSEAEFAKVVDAIAEIVRQANLVRAKVPNVFGALTDSMGGTAGDGTIGAISNALTGVGTSLAAAAGANTVLAALSSRTSQAIYFVNQLCAATGISPIVDNTGSVKSYSTTFAAVSTGTGTAASGADATTNAGVLVADVNARLTILRNAIASMAAKLNAMTADANATLPLPVVAG